MTYEVTLRDDTVETVGGADAYQQEGPMTTFFLHGSGRGVLDAWSTRVASFRTSEILKIRLVDETVATPTGRVLTLSRSSA
ncbi:MAG: hypothetical protein ACRD29_02090 [Acidimicrobiales bacterium]